jgi:hypothetical protein
MTDQLGIPITRKEAITMAQEIGRRAEEERTRPITPLSIMQRSAIVFTADMFIEMFLKKLRPIIHDIEAMSPDLDDDTLEELVFNYIRCALWELQHDDLNWDAIKTLIDSDDTDYLAIFQKMKDTLQEKYPNV